MSESATPETATVAAPSGKPTWFPFAVILGVVAILLAIGGVLYATVFSKLGGSGSPEAAVTQFIDGLNNRDSVAMYGVLAPDEMDHAQGLSEEITRITTELALAQASTSDDTAAISEDPSAEAERQKQLLIDSGILDSITFRVDNPAYATTELNDENAVVTFTGGHLVFAIDQAKLKEGFTKLEPEIRTQLASADNSLARMWFQFAMMATEGGVDTAPLPGLDQPEADLPDMLVGEKFTEEQIDEIIAQIRETLEQLPNMEATMGLQDWSTLTLTAGEETHTLAGDMPAEDVAKLQQIKAQLVTVKLDNSWYISPTMSMLELAAQFVNTFTDETWELGQIATRDQLPRASSPEEALSLFLERNWAASSEMESAVDALAFPERRVLQRYVPWPLVREALGNPEFNAIVSEVEPGEVAVDDDTALVPVKSLTIALTEPGGQTIEVKFADDCLLMDEATASAFFGDSQQQRMCVGDLKTMLNQLNILPSYQPALGAWVVQHESSGWYVSLTGSFAELLRANLATIKGEELQDLITQFSELSPFGGGSDFDFGDGDDFDTFPIEPVEDTGASLPDVDDTTQTA